MPQIRYVTPVDEKRADGLVAEVYGQAKRELGAVGAPFQMLSPAPELLASMWSLLRESLICRIAPISPQMILNYVSERVLGLPRSY